MGSELSWRHSIGARLTAMALLLLLVTAIFIVANVTALNSFESDRDWARVANQTSVNRSALWANLYLLSDPAERPRIRSEMDTTVKAVVKNLADLELGSPSRDVPAPKDPRVIAALTEIKSQIDERDQLYTTLFRSSTLDEAAPALARINDITLNAAQHLRDLADAYVNQADAKARRFKVQQFAFAAIVLLVFAVVLRSTLRISRRVRGLATTAERITAGDLDERAQADSRDELGSLGRSFNAMTEDLAGKLGTEKEARRHLEELVEAVKETVGHLASVAPELLAATAQQAASAQQQAASVSETMSTVEEMAQAAQQVAERARAVAASTQRSDELGQAGQRAVADAIERMLTAKDRAENIAARSVELAEQTLAIGEIVAVVTDLAEQVHFLAINAAVEASRAGEEGKGFAVVAAEVKALADEAKKATEQVKRILGQIQSSMSLTVAATEEGSESVGAAVTVVGTADESIQSLTKVAADAARAAAQISASASQQAVGTSQINEAMRSVNEATSQAMSSAQQTERAAQDLDALGARLKELLTAHEG